MKKILITGHEGLVGRPLLERLTLLGYEVTGLDIAASSPVFKGDITEYEALKKAIDGVQGVIHLAAVSRVIWGQQDPEKCELTNAKASSQLIELAVESATCEWCIVASSREVYGEQEDLPVTEQHQLKPVNIYGESKLKMEQKALEAREAGLNTAILRLANVYGSTSDHEDRVLPSFCRAAVEGKDLRVDGAENTFDFTHIDDTVNGFLKLIARLEQGHRNIPPIHLLPGKATTLQQAANMAIEAANSDSRITIAPSRSYDVSKFVGDPSLAKTELDWQAEILPEQGIKMLVALFEKELSGQGAVA